MEIIKLTIHLRNCLALGFCRVVAATSTKTFNLTWASGVVFSHWHWDLLDLLTIEFFLCPKNHGISKLVAWKSKRTLRSIQGQTPTLPYLEGPSQLIVRMKKKHTKIKSENLKCQITFFWEFITQQLFKKLVGFLEKPFVAKDAKKEIPQFFGGLKFQKKSLNVKGTIVIGLPPPSLR